jgi:hypothetical protein
MPVLFGGGSWGQPRRQPLKLNVAAYLGHCNARTPSAMPKMNATRFDGLWRD